MIKFLSLSRTPISILVNKNLLSAPHEAFQSCDKINTLIRRSTSSCNSSSDANLVLASESEDGRIKTLTLNNPKKRNCLSLEMMTEIDKNLTDGKRLRLIILRASGGVFSSGHDLKELRNGSKEFQMSVFDLSAEICIKIRNFPVPVIAVISDQIVAASGTQLIASTDMILSTKKSTFSTPGSSVGLFCSTPGISLSRKANQTLSAYMLLTGLPVEAEEALRGGLITKMYEDAEKLENGVQTMTDAILSKSKPVISLGKKFFYQQKDLSVEEAFKRGAKVMVDNLNHEDAKIGIDCFVDKKKNPKWTHANFGLDKDEEK